VDYGPGEIPDGYERAVGKTPSVYSATGKQAEIDRKNNVLSADYSGYNSLDDIWRGLSSSEITLLKTQSASYKKRVAELDTINAFRQLSEEDQAVFFAEANEATRIVLENDGYIAGQTETLAPSPDEAEAEKAARLAAEANVLTPEEQAQQDQLAEAARIQAETDRIAAEAAAANVTPAVARGSVEELYPGVEKLANNAYKLTVDPGDGSSPEYFWGESQKECFIKLRESKAHATKELRRRRKKIEISEELRAMQVEVVPYAPLMEPQVLTPKQIFDLTEQLKDPTTVLEATRVLRQASYTPEECARYNEAIEKQRFNDTLTVANRYFTEHDSNNGGDFYICPENTKSLREFMSELNWAVTDKNLDLAISTLKEQGALLDAPPTPPPSVQPAPVVPVTPVVTPAAPVAAPKAPAGALPAAGRVLRPGSSAENSTGIQPTVRLGARTGQASQVQPMTVEEANSYSAADLKTKYRTDPVFRARLEAYWAAGGR